MWPHHLDRLSDVLNLNISKLLYHNDCPVVVVVQMVTFIGIGTDHLLLQVVDLLL